MPYMSVLMDPYNLAREGVPNAGILNIRTFL
jgi:hypothetical protein